MSVLPQVVTRNWRLKVSALVLSIFLWAIVTVQPRNLEIIPAVPVQVVVNDPDWALAEAPSPTTVSVHLGGMTRELLELPRGSEAFIRVPIDQVTTTDSVVRLRPDWVVLRGGSNIVVQSITPNAIALRFEPTLTTAVPLSLRTRNELPEGLALVQPLGLSPQVTAVRGPARIVETLDSVYLTPLDLSEVTRSGTYRVHVDSTDLSGLSFQPNTAQVSVNLQPESERVLGFIPVTIVAPRGVDPETLTADPPFIDVTLRGALQLLNQASAPPATAYVAASDLEGIAAGNDWMVPVRIRGLPPLVRATSSTDSVRVHRAVAPPTPDTLPRDTLPRDTVPRDTVPRDTVPGTRPAAGARP